MAFSDYDRVDVLAAANFFDLFDEPVEVPSGLDFAEDHYRLGQEDAADQNRPADARGAPERGPVAAHPPASRFEPASAETLFRYSKKKPLRNPHVYSPEDQAIMTLYHLAAGLKPERGVAPRCSPRAPRDSNWAA